MSLEEQRQRQEEENKNTDAQGTAPASGEIPDSEEALLQQALRMSGAVSDTSVGSTPFPDDVRLDLQHCMNKSKMINVFVNCS